MAQHKFTTAAFTLPLIFAASLANADGDNNDNNQGNNNRNQISFNMVSANPCVSQARARVRVVSTGTAEDMTIHASGLPANTDFDFFVIQVPKAPFGLSWYQGDVQTDEDGEADQHFRGRFNIETFIVNPANMPVPAPQVHHNAFPDALASPPTAPVHTYHLGLWFNSPADARKAGCPATVTPFNGEHNAGIQVLNTSNFPDLQGPLFNLSP